MVWRYWLQLKVGIITDHNGRGTPGWSGSICARCDGRFITGSPGCPGAGVARPAKQALRRDMFVERPSAKISPEAMPGVRPLAPLRVFLGPFEEILRQRGANEPVIAVVEVRIHGEVEIARLLEFLPLVELGIKASGMISIDAQHFVQIADVAKLSAQDVQWPVGYGKQGVVPGGNRAQSRAAKHDGAGRDEIALPDVLESGDRRMPGRRPVPGCLRSAFLLDPGIVKAAGTLWLTIQEVRLLLQLVGGDPVIIAVQQRNIFAAGSTDAAGHDRIAANVFLREQQADALRIFLLIRDDGLARAIR